VIVGFLFGTVIYLSLQAKQGPVGCLRSVGQ